MSSYYHHSERREQRYVQNPDPQSTSPRKEATATVSSQPTLGKLPKSNRQNMEFENPLIYKSGDEDIELATKRTTAYDASLECISVAGDTNNIIPYDPSQPRS
ncbi:unnamed protein product [Adineta steineri]|uniref:Uncharacterized protein n=1 Tax=Adineta steineri TaxID=433720 RepID=A0A813WKP6_9BILA|nr:unnamed protein product [Adineta steineri]CAF1226297.1 unnamed protein product [Adineta steineri]